MRSLSARIAVASLIFFVAMCPVSAIAFAQDPPTPPPSPKPSIDQLIDRIGDLRKQRTDVEKQEQAAITDLRARFKELQDKLDKLGLIEPAPKPVPPKPPEPPVPVPVDPLKTKLKVAFESDTADVATKREQAKDLAALYRQAAVLASDAMVVTSGDLLKRVRDAAGTLIGVDALKEVRRAAGAELAGVLPTDAPLSDAQRLSAAVLFKKLAEILEGL